MWFCFLELNVQQSQVESTKFIKFMTERILTSDIWSQIRSQAAEAAMDTTPAPATADGNTTEGNTVAAATTAPVAEQMPLRLLQLLVELCAYCGPLETAANDCVATIYARLLEYMPLPPLVDIEPITAAATTTTTDASSSSADVPAITISEAGITTAAATTTPSFQFSHAECLLYALHALGKQVPEFFTFGADAGQLKEFRARLQYLARGTQGCIKKLQESLRGKSKDELSNNAENKLKVTALKTTSNINVLIRDLFHAPPSFKSTVQPSWLVQRKAVGQAGGQQVRRMVLIAQYQHS